MQSRSAFRTRAQNLSNSPSPSSRLGRLFLPFGRNSVMPSLGSNLLLRPVELGSIDPHAMQNDRELTRDCNLTLRSPLRLTSLTPKPSRWTISGRALAEPRLLRIDNCAAWHHHSDHSSRSRLKRGVCSRSRKPCRIVNRCLEGERGDRTNPRHRHKSVDLRIMGKARRKSLLGPAHGFLASDLWS